MGREPVAREQAKADLLGVQTASVLIPPFGRESDRRGLRRIVEEAAIVG